MTLSDGQGPPGWAMRVWGPANSFHKEMVCELTAEWRERKHASAGVAEGTSFLDLGPPGPWGPVDPAENTDFPAAAPPPATPYSQYGRSSVI